MTLVFAVKHLYNILEFFYCFCPFLFFYTFFKNLVLINRRNGPRYQRVLALCAFFNRGDAEGTNSSKMFVFSVCVCFVLCKFVYRTDFVVFE